jgi:hypothetical protein
MTKKALLIGINYSNDSSHALQGCIYDVYEMKKVLVNVFGYTESDIIMISDSNNDIEPTYSNILENFKKLVEISEDLEELFIHYSGHGTQIRDKDINRDEPDGKDEGIIPIDYYNSGIMTDDILYDNFFSKVDSKCRTVCVFDSCNSGSISDLDYSWLSDGKKIYKTHSSNRQLQSIEKKVFVLSGCVDDKYSYEAVDPETSHPCGALSLELRNVLKENNWILSIDILITSLTQKLKKTSYIQTPVLTTGFDSKQTELVFINPKP